MKTYILIGLVGFCIGTGTGLRAQPKGKFTRTEDVIYGRKFGAALTLDVFQPEKPNGAAVIDIISGNAMSNHEWIRAED